MSLFRVNAIEAFAPRIGDFTHVFREFDFGHKVFALLDGRQFIDGAEFGIAIGCNETFAHTITVDAAALGNDRRDGAFVQTIGSHDFAVLQSRLVEQDAHLLGEIGHVARVNAHAEETLTAREEHFLCNTDSGGYTRLEGVVSVDQEDRGTAINFGIALECIVFSVEEHDPAVRHGADHGDAEGFSGEGCGRTVHPTDVSRARAVDSSVDVVRTARTHVGHRTPLCSAHNAIGLCGDEGLVVDLRKQESFDQLSFNDGSSDSDEWLIGIDDAPFRHGIDVACEAEMVQILKERLGE